jgi:hypothetical protein
LPGELTQNPFASTHSLDQNPFDDPAPAAAPATDRAAELDRRERELARRETELSQRAEHVRKHGRNNWPPCKLIIIIWNAWASSKLLVLPLIYHDINEEIPEESRSVILRMYQLWLVLLGTLIVNFVACLLILLAGSSEGGKDLGGSIGYVCELRYTACALTLRISVTSSSSRHCRSYYGIGKRLETIDNGSFLL